MLSNKIYQSIRKATIKTIFGCTFVIGTVEWTTHLPSQGKSSEFYHGLVDQVVVPLMRRFLDPEVAHNIALEALQRGWSVQHHPSAKEQRVSLESTLFGKTKSSESANVVVRVESKTFSNPIGLAAGFDKDGTSIQGLLALGFGFVEIGTVTPKPQPGNQKPRMFRLSEDKAIINRYGFNSKGSHAVQQNLRSWRKEQEQYEQEQHGTETTATTPNQLFLWKHFLNSILSGKKKNDENDYSKGGIVGINIGKNKSTTDAKTDYVTNIHQLGNYADYIVINISSPNTPQLRDLQQADPLQRLVSACLEARDKLSLVPSSSSSSSVPPLLIKLSPDLTNEELKEIVPILLQVDGLIISNTTTQRNPFELRSKNRIESGGLSGGPIKDRSTECIRTVYALTDGQIPIIGVGGVGTGQDAYDKLKAGASLVQIYSMMIYNGPGTVSRIRHELADLMLQNGQRSLVDDVIGRDHEEIFWRKRIQRSEKRANEELMIIVDK